MWPLAGVTTVGVTRSDAMATMEAAIESGIQAFDTAYSYGYAGESDRLLGTFIGSQRDRFTVIGKVGQRWTADRKRVIDGSARALSGDAERSLDRIGTERFDLLMLHSPDPNVSIESSAESMMDLQRRGLCDHVGICNASVDQWRRFASVADCRAIQCPLNLMQRDSLDDLIPACNAADCQVYVFWTLMKGLLAGKISRDHQFAEGDSRPNYEIFQGRQRERAHRILDGMRKLSGSSGLSIAQISIGWTLSQRGVTAALVGAHRAQQVREIAQATRLASDLVQAVDDLVESESGSPPDRPERS